MRKIENLTDLRLEIRRLEVQKASQEKAISNDIREIHLLLSPAHVIKRTISSLFDYTTDTNSMVKGGVNMGVSFLIEKVLLRNSSGIVRNLVSFLATNIATNIASKNSGAVVGKIKSYLGNLFGGRKQNEYFDSTYQEREIYNNDY
jgi:hypothetical protein